MSGELCLNATRHFNPSQYVTRISVQEYLVFSARKYEHTSPLLRELHWLKVPQRIQFRLCVCWRIAVSTDQHRATLLRPSTQLPAVQRVTSDLLTRLHYWSRRHDAQHWATALSWRLQQEPGTLCLLMSGMRLLWSPSVKNWKLCCLGSVSLWIDSRTCLVACETWHWHC